MKPKLRGWLGYGVGLPLAIVAVALLIEHFRGEAQLTAYTKSLVKAGEKLSITGFMAKVPAASNGFPILIQELNRLPRMTDAQRPPLELYADAGKRLLMHQQRWWAGSGKPQ